MTTTHPSSPKDLDDHSPIGTPIAGKTRLVPRTTPHSLLPPVTSGDVPRLRSMVAEFMDGEMVSCSMDDFFEGYLPFVPSNEDVNNCLHKLIEQGKLINTDEKTHWTDYPTKPSNYSTTEPVLFKKLDDIINTCRLYHLKNPDRTSNNYIFKSLPSNHFDTELGDANFKVDGCFTDDQFRKVRLSHAMVPAEYKKIRNWTEVVDNRIQLLGGVNHIMVEDPRRLFMYGVTIEDDRMAVWYFSRSHSVKSQSFNWVTNHATFVRVWLAFINATDKELGLDPHVHQCLQTTDKGEELTYIYQFPQENNGDLDKDLYFKKIKDVIDPRTLRISGRNTRVFEAQLVKSFQDPVPLDDPPLDDSPLIIKISWIDKCDPTESENQRKLFKDIEEFAENSQCSTHLGKADMKNMERMSELLKFGKFKDLFLTHVYHDVGACTKPLHPHAYFQPGLFDKPPLYSTGKATEIPKTPLADKQIQHIKYTTGDPQARRYAQKKQTRVVFKELCVPLHHLETMGEAMSVLEQSVDCLQLMYHAGWVHRDISSGNILAFKKCDQWTVKLADLEYARKFPATPSGHPDPKTGTPHFMPHEVIFGVTYHPVSTAGEQINQFVNAISEGPTVDPNVVEQVDPNSHQDPPKEVQKEAERIVHSFTCDIESVWWIALWLVTIRVKDLPSAPFTEIFNGSLTPSPERAKAFTNPIRTHLQLYDLQELSPFIGPLEQMRDLLSQFYYAVGKKAYEVPNVRENILLYAPHYSWMRNLFGAVHETRSSWAGVTQKIVFHTVPERKRNYNCLASKKVSGCVVGSESPPTTPNSKKQKTCH